MILQTYFLQNTPCCCLTAGMEPRIFAQSTIIKYLHDTGFRITQDNSVQPFYLSETAAFFNAEKKREEMGIILPFTDVQPLISFAAAPGMDRGSAMRELCRLFNMLLTAYTTGAMSEQVFHAAVAAPLCLLRDMATSDLIILPPRLVQRCTLAEPKTALTYHYPYIHPDGDQAALPNAAYFFLSALLYRCLTATAPFNTAAVPFAGMYDSLFDMQGKKTKKTIEDNQTGEASEPAEQLVQNIRDGVYIPIGFRCPGLVKEVQELINRALLLTNTKQAAQAALSSCEQLCTYRSTAVPLFYTSQTNSTKITAAGMQTAPDNQSCRSPLPTSGTLEQPTYKQLLSFIHAERKQINRKRFLRKNTGKLIAAATGLIVLLAVAIGVIHVATQPPETAGLSPEAVVHGFYTAVGALDQVQASAYTKNKAGSEYENLLVHLFVTSKMREAYERKKIYYSPHEFHEICTTVHSQQQEQDTGHIDIETKRYKTAVITALNGGSIYGISQLSISPATDMDCFDVSFYYWVPLFSSEKTAALIDESDEFITARSFFPLQILRYRDRVHVTAISGNYFISKIEPIERKVIVESSTALIEETMLPLEQQPSYLIRF